MGQIELNNRISYSQLSLYTTCPKHWKLNYVDKISKFEPSIYLIFGSAMHTVIQTYLKTMYSKTIKEADLLDLTQLLQKELINEFKKAEKNNIPPCTKKELYEFFNDGIFIIDWFKKHRNDYFQKRDWTLIGCEVPINIDLINNIEFIGIIDVALQHKITGLVKIIDIKTSTMGWNKYQKRDKNKTSQLLLYKQFFAKQHNIPIENISIEYLIFKRKLYENCDFPQKRIQTFVPANGKPSINNVNNSLNSFIDNAFNDNGNYIGNEIATPSKNACRFCEFNQTKYCDEGIK